MSSLDGRPLLCAIHSVDWPLFLLQLMNTDLVVAQKNATRRFVTDYGVNCLSKQTANWPAHRQLIVSFTFWDLIRRQFLIFFFNLRQTRTPWATPVYETSLWHRSAIWAEGITVDCHANIQKKPEYCTLPWVRNEPFSGENLDTSRSSPIKAEACKPRAVQTTDTYLESGAL